LRQGMAQIDLVLQAGAEQVVGVGGNTVRGNGALAHKLVRNCKKTAVIVAKTCSPGTREMRQRRYTSCVKWVLQGRRSVARSCAVRVRTGTTSESTECTRR